MEGKTIIIPGLPRSGSSLLTQLLIKSGIYMGKRFAGPDIFNEQGYFEDLTIKDRFRKSFKKRGFTITDKVPESIIVEVFAEKKEELRKIILANNVRKVWGFKDIHAALYLPYAISEFRNPHIILCLRDLLPSLYSLKHSRKKYRMTLEDASEIQYILLKRTLELVSHESLPFFPVFYEDMLNQPAIIVKKLGIFLGRSTPEIDFGFIDKKFKHF